MPLYFFRIRNGRYSGASEYGTEFADGAAAWNEMSRVCSELLTSISRKLSPNSEWQMELLDESKKTVFRISLVSETFE
jgi:hypothetical protein